MKRKLSKLLGTVRTLYLASTIIAIIGIATSCQTTTPNSEDSKLEVQNDSNSTKQNDDNSNEKQQVEDKTPPPEPKKKLFSCSSVSARFSHEKTYKAEELLGKPNKEYSTSLYTWLIWYNKVEDEFDGDSPKHLVIKFPTIFNQNDNDNVVECISQGGQARVGAYYITLP